MAKNSTHPELGDPDECGSYWIKLPKDNTSLEQPDRVPLPKKKPLQEMYTMSCSEEGITRELCEIYKGPCAYGLNPRYVSGPDDENPDSPHLPELEFNQPVVQFDMRKANLTIRQLAIIGASTWALLKRDAAIMFECRQQFKEEIAQETLECLTGCKEEEPRGPSLLSQLHPSNIVLPMTYLEPN